MTKAFTAEELAERRGELELAIWTLIEKFREETGFGVSAIEIEIIATASLESKAEQRYVNRVLARVDLP